MSPNFQPEATKVRTLSMFFGKHRSESSMAVFVALAMLIVGQNAWAQGCIVSRISMPVVGPGGGESHVLTEHEPWLSCDRLQVATTYRTFHSFRHFVGTEEQVNREIAKSQVNNEVHAFDLTAAYTINR